MPTNLVKTKRDEGLWSKAKAQAAKQGHAEDWAYVNGIYQRMQGGGSKKTASLLQGIRKSAAVLHAYPDITEEGIADVSTSQVRKQTLDQLAQMAKRDMLIVRPRVGPKAKKEALDRAKDMIDWDYSTSDLIMSAFAPSSIKDDSRKAIICSALIAKSYPNIKFRGDKPSRSVRPGDIHSSDKMREVAAFSSGGRNSLFMGSPDLRINKKTKVYNNLDKFKKHLKPGDVILTKPSFDYKPKAGGVSNMFSAGIGLPGKIKRIFNKGDPWTHSALWIDDDSDEANILENVRNLATRKAEGLNAVN